MEKARRAVTSSTHRRDIVVNIVIYISAKRSASYNNIIIFVRRLALASFLCWKGSSGHIVSCICVTWVQASRAAHPLIEGSAVPSSNQRRVSGLIPHPCSHCVKVSLGKTHPQIPPDEPSIWHDKNCNTLRSICHYDLPLQQTGSMSDRTWTSRSVVTITGPQ